VAQSVEYVLGSVEAERARLLAQCRTFEPASAREIFERIDTPDWPDEAERALREEGYVLVCASSVRSVYERMGWTGARTP
jgi:hypothetical protein